MIRLSTPIRNCAFSADPKMRGNGFAVFFKNLKFKGSSFLPSNFAHELNSNFNANCDHSIFKPADLLHNRTGADNCP